MGEETRIGVWVCECGGNIGDVVDVQSVTDLLKSEVAHVEQNSYLCSSPSVEKIKSTIKEQGLNRVVLACCTPNMHNETFKSNLKEVGLNPALLEIVNIREQCSWVHKGDHEGATEKALDLIKGGIERVRNSVALESKTMDVSKEVLVIGGGVAGITASLSMAEFGMKVHLVEKNPSIGGHMIQYPKVFPTMDCSQCILTPKMSSVNHSQNIDLLSYAEVTDVSGVPGDFTVKVRLKPRGVDVERCIGCGTCSSVCPTVVASEHDEGLYWFRSLIYSPRGSAGVSTDKLLDYLVDVPKGSSYREKNAYMMYESDKEKTFAPIDDLYFKLRKPLNVVVLQAH